MQERIEKKKQEERDREYEVYKKERGEDTQRDQRHLPGGGVSFAGGQGQSAAPPARGRGRGSVSNLPSWMAKVKREERGASTVCFFPITRTGWTAAGKRICNDVLLDFYPSLHFPFCRRRRARVGKVVVRQLCRLHLARRKAALRMHR